MKKILNAGCAQDISSFNPVECKYEIFHIIRDNEIYEYHEGKNSYIGGAIEEINNFSIPYYWMKNVKSSLLGLEDVHRYECEF